MVFYCILKAISHLSNASYCRTFALLSTNLRGIPEMRQYVTLLCITFCVIVIAIVIHDKANDLFCMNSFPSRSVKNLGKYDYLI